MSGLLHFQGHQNNEIMPILQVLKACDCNWGFSNPLSRQLSALTSSSFIPHAEVEHFRQLAGISRADFKEIFMSILSQTQPPDFMLGSPLKTKYCVCCDKFESPTHQPMRTAYYLSIDVGSYIRVQQCIEESLHVCRECIDCICPPGIRVGNQFETVRFNKYPKILAIFPYYKSERYRLELDKTIVMPDNSHYTLIGFVACNQRGYLARAAIDNVFYDCVNKCKISEKRT